MPHKALCVGLNYPSNPWPSLFGCVNDALRWAHLLDKKLKFDTRVLIDQSPTGEVSTNPSQVPTFANITAQLRWLCNAQPGDMLTFVFAGYGTQRIWGDVCENALVCGDVEHLTLLGDGDVSQIFRSIPAGVLLTVIADCTFGTHLVDVPYVIEFSSPAQFAATALSMSEKNKNDFLEQPMIAPPLHAKSEAWENSRHARAHPRALTPVNEDFIPSIKLHPGVTAFCFAAAQADEVALDANIKGHQSGILTFSLLNALQKFDYTCSYWELMQAANEIVVDIQDKYMPALDQTISLSYSMGAHPAKVYFGDPQGASLAAELRRMRWEEKRRIKDEWRRDDSGHTTHEGNSQSVMHNMQHMTQQQQQQQQQTRERERVNSGQEGRAEHIQQQGRRDASRRDLSRGAASRRDLSQHERLQHEQHMGNSQALGRLRERKNTREEEHFDLMSRRDPREVDVVEQRDKGSGQQRKHERDGGRQRLESQNSHDILDVKRRGFRDANDVGETQNEESAFFPRHAHQDASSAGLEFQGQPVACPAFARGHSSSAVGMREPSFSPRQMRGEFKEAREASFSPRHQRGEFRDMREQLSPRQRREINKGDSRLTSRQKENQPPPFQNTYPACDEHMDSIEDDEGKKVRRRRAGSSRLRGAGHAAEYEHEREQQQPLQQRERERTGSCVAYSTHSSASNRHEHPSAMQQSTRDVNRDVNREHRDKYSDEEPVREERRQRQNLRLPSPSVDSRSDRRASASACSDPARYSPQPSHEHEDDFPSHESPREQMPAIFGMPDLLFTTGIAGNLNFAPTLRTVPRPSPAGIMQFPQAGQRKPSSSQHNPAGEISLFPQLTHLNPPPPLAIDPLSMTLPNALLGGTIPGAPIKNPLAPITAAYGGAGSASAPLRRETKISLNEEQIQNSSEKKEEQSEGLSNQQAPSVTHSGALEETPHSAAHNANLARSHSTSLSGNVPPFNPYGAQSPTFPPPPTLLHAPPPQMPGMGITPAFMSQTGIAGQIAPPPPMFHFDAYPSSQMQGSGKQQKPALEVQWNAPSLPLSTNLTYNSFGNTVGPHNNQSSQHGAPSGYPPLVGPQMCGPTLGPQSPRSVAGVAFPPQGQGQQQHQDPTKKVTDVKSLNNQGGLTLPVTRRSSLVSIICPQPSVQSPRNQVGLTCQGSLRADRVKQFSNLMNNR